jgi:hypothetical protein
MPEEPELAKWMLVFGQQDMIEALSVLKEVDKIPIEVSSNFRYNVEEVKNED